MKKKVIGLLTGLVNAYNHTKCVSLSNQKCEIQHTFIYYILMNPVKNFTTIHLQLNYTNVLEVVILSMTYVIKYVFQIKQKI